MPQPSLTPAEKFAQRGVRWSQDRNGRAITLGGQTYTGIRSDLVVTRGDAQYGGLKRAQGFDFLIARADWTGPQTIKDGVEVVDEAGSKWHTAGFRMDAVHVIVTCAGVWG